MAYVPNDSPFGLAYANWLRLAGAPNVGQDGADLMLRFVDQFADCDLAEFASCARSIASCAAYAQDPHLIAFAQTCEATHNERMADRVARGQDPGW